ncbi:Ensconsin [Bienertia sinuspersici]
MGGIWLLCNYEGKKFDVRVKDIDESSFMDLVDDLFDESLKQDVSLPEMFRLFYHNRCGQRVELVDDFTLIRMWALFLGKEEIEIWLEKAIEVKYSFKMALQNRKERLRREEDRRKQVEEQARMVREKERLRIEEQEKIQREIEEIQKFTVAIEIPVVNAQKLEVEYERVFSSQVADEVFPGYSIPEATQNTQNTQPSQ